MFSNYLNTAFNMGSMSKEIHPSFERFMLAATALRGITDQAEIARQINVLDQHMTNWKKRGLPKPKIMDLAAWAGCDPYWLRDGTGAMLTSPVYMTAEIEQVVQKMVAMEPQQQYQVKQMVDILTTTASNEVEPNGGKGSGKRQSSQ
jgi:hypothetical protein